MNTARIAPYKIQQNDTIVSFLQSGEPFRFTAKNISIMLYQSNPLYGGMGNIWLRVHHEGSIRAYPLIGLHSQSSFHVGEHEVSYRGSVADISYVLDFRLADDEHWFWDLHLSAKDKEVDLIFAQDIGLGDQGLILANELFSAQYIDYHRFEDDQGFHLGARQNMSQAGRNPYLQFGLLEGKAISFATDGLAFFGLDYKRSNEIAALSTNLPGRIQQGELSMIALQTERQVLNGEADFCFYAAYRPDLETAIREPIANAELRRRHDGIRQSDALQAVEPLRHVESFGTPYSSKVMRTTELHSLYPVMKLKEEAGELLSFHTDDHRHVVTMAKELQVERAHASMITTFADLNEVNTNLINSSNFIYGLFNAQVVAGNTMFNKFVSANRGFLNITKTSGQRIYIKLDGRYRQLQLPAVFEMGMNEAAWHYILPNDDRLTIRSFAIADRMDLALDIKSRDNKTYDFIISNQLVLGEHEYQGGINLDVSEDGHILCFGSSEPNAFYPNLTYCMQLPGIDFSYSDDRIFFDDNETRNGTMLTISVHEASSFQVIISAYLDGSEDQNLKRDVYVPARERAAYLEAYEKLIQGFELIVPRTATTPDSKSTSHKTAHKHADLRFELESLNETAWWFAHNALVHFAVPKGLEQPGAAAWGTRDICQGPIEFFLAFQHFDLVRAILLQIFSHQSETSREWPQWFMFDRYNGHSDHCHGDVVFWPLKALGEYLASTDDLSILRELRPYQRADGSFTSEASTILEHVEAALGNIRGRFLPDTHLISFAGGDWNDALQPADESNRDLMVSGWTQILAYRALKLLGGKLDDADVKLSDDLLELADLIRDDFHRYLNIDGVTAGMLIQEGKAKFRPLFHPRDEVSGIHHRLIPLTDGILGELIEPGDVERQMALIREKLVFPDGAHLMDHPPRYNGGISELFVRAEQATYIGREIGLMYTHAHIRYIETLGATGHREQAWQALLQINPMTVEKVVANAAIRPRNNYFSSSDADCRDRYEFSDRYDELKQGKIAVKGGWRIYSSGPGLYLKVMLTDVFGIKITADSLEISPTLPKGLNGTSLKLMCFGTPLHFTYFVQGSDCELLDSDGNSIGEKKTSVYGKAGIRITKDTLLKAGDRFEVHI